MISCLVVFATGLPLARWDRLLRSDWHCCGRALPLGPALGGFGTPRPTILQLFVYLEVTPTIGSLLQMEPRRMKRAIFLGSALLLVLETAWSALGLAMVGFESGLREDPVAVLLRRNGSVASAVLALGCSAVLSTILGTNLALRSFLGDSRWAYGLCALLPALAPKEAFFAAIDFAGATRFGRPIHIGPLQEQLNI